MSLFALSLRFLWRWGEIFGRRGNGIIDFYGGGFCIVRPSRLHATASLHSASFSGLRARKADLTCVCVIGNKANFVTYTLNVNSGNMNTHVES